MIHPRFDIRRRVKEILESSEVLPQKYRQGIYASRAIPVIPSNLPAILVQTSRESAQRIDRGTGLQRRELVLEIAVKALGEHERVQNEVDEVSFAIEKLLFWPTVFELDYVCDIVFRDYELVLSDEGERVINSCYLSWLVTYEIDAASVDAYDKPVDLEKYNGKIDSNLGEIGLRGGT